MYLASVILLCYIDTKTAMQRDWVCTGFCQYYHKNGSFWIFTRKQRDWLIKSRWRGNNKKKEARKASPLVLRFMGWCSRTRPELLPWCRKSEIQQTSGIHAADCPVVFSCISLRTPSAGSRRQERGQAGTWHSWAASGRMRTGHWPLHTGNYARPSTVCSTDFFGWVPCTALEQINFMWLYPWVNLFRKTLICEAFAVSKGLNLCYNQAN